MTYNNVPDLAQAAFRPTTLKRVLIKKMLLVKRYLRFFYDNIT